jgi:hypothetical protein
MLVVILLIALAACQAQSDSPRVMMPGYVTEAPARVQQAYQNAVDHPDHFETVPCYCGCSRIGHTSEVSCFIKEVAEDGTITFDPHASGCGVCVDIAHDVMTMRAQGKSAVEIRQSIDATYSSVGPGTDTPYSAE